MDKKKLIVVGMIVSVYLLSTFASYSYFAGAVSKKATTSPVATISKNGSKKLLFDDTLPKTEACPMNGAYYSKQQKEWWEKHRPLGVMIENHEDARPQSGLTSADVVYEAVAEGSITRFLAIFYCQDAEFVGPVRSARTYFLDFVSEYGDYPLYAHVGGANRSGPADALGQIEDYGWARYNDLNQFRMGCPIYCQLLTRIGDGSIAIEHTMYSSTTKLWDFARAGKTQPQKLTNVDEDGKSWDENFVPYTFKKDADAAQRGTSQSIHAEHWGGYKAYFVDWTYDKASNSYKRKNGGVDHIDKNNGKVIAPKNLVILSMVETRLGDEEGHLLYKTKGQGKATIFMDGKQITGTWRKSSRTGRTQIFDSTGAAVAFNRGQIWFEILPTDGVLTVK